MTHASYYIKNFPGRVFILCFFLAYLIGLVIEHGGGGVATIMALGGTALLLIIGGLCCIISWFMNILEELE